MPPHIDGYVGFDCEAITRYTRKRCAPGKRRLDFDGLDKPVKRRRSFGSTEAAESPKGNERSIESIIAAVERLSTEPRLVSDGSRENTLPTISGKHKDLNAITPDTMSRVLEVAYSDRIDQLTVIDCRYPYEFEGGHIKGAINLYTKQAIKDFIQNSATSSEKNHVLIFHCEFSSERGPKMYRHLRSLDRELNIDSYPKLNFPEIYLLEGGYKAFYESQINHCTPQSYTPMLQKDHSEDLRHFRVKSKSWAAGDNPRHRSSAPGKQTKLCF
jgi:rhodanese-related sulfurtransferase